MASRLNENENVRALKDALEKKHIKYITKDSNRYFVVKNSENCDALSFQCVEFSIR